MGKAASRSPNAWLDRTVPARTRPPASPFMPRYEGGSVGIDAGVPLHEQLQSSARTQPKLASRRPQQDGDTDPQLFVQKSCKNGDDEG